MKTLMINSLATCVVVVLTMCQSSPDELENIDQLNNGTYTLTVDRVLNNAAAVTTQNDELSDDQYMTVSQLIEYQITFSNDAENISIEPVSIIGERIETTDEAYYYELVDGVFAGGRLIVRNTGSQLEAEFTIYGSGVPITKSERGVLEFED